MKRKNKQVLLVACASILVVGSHASAASVTQLTAPNQISPNATSFTVPGTIGTVSSGSSLGFGTGDNSLTFSRGSGSFEIDQAGFNYGNTSFADNTRLVGAGGFQGPGDSGPITLTFFVPVTQFELNAEEFQVGHYDLVFTLRQSLEQPRNLRLWCKREDPELCGTFGFG